MGPADAGPPNYPASFDTLWSRYDALYPAFDIKQIAWDTLGAHYRPLAAAAQTDSEFAAIVSDMLAPLRDVHAWLTRPDGSKLATYTPPYFVNWQLDGWLAAVEQHSLHQEPTNWGYAAIGTVPYLYFGAWNTSQFNAAAVDAVLEQFRNAPAMIIDVRMNGGGDDALAYAVAERFFDQPRIVSYVQYRNGPAHSDLGPLQSTSLAPRGSWQFTKPVLLLIGRGCFSSNEEFIAAMRELPNVTLAGDTTGGGSGNPIQFPLAHGWSYSVPRWNQYTAEHALIEWHGIAPATVVPMTAVDVAAGRDPVFDYAVSWAGPFNAASAAVSSIGTRRSARP